MKVVKLNIWLSMVKIFVVSAFFLFFYNFNAFSMPLTSNSYNLNLYGHNIKINYIINTIQDSDLRSSNQLQNALCDLETPDLTVLKDQLDQYAADFGMDDMAYLLFIDKLVKVIYAQTNQAALLKYAILKLKGYDVLLGYSKTDLTVYGRLDFKVLNTLYVTHRQLVYTDLSFSQQTIPTEQTLFEENLQTARAFVLNEFRAPFYNAKKSKYAYHFEYEGYDYYFKGFLNLSMVEYYRELPDIDFCDVYLNYQFSDIAKRGLIADIKEAVSGMGQAKAIDFILKFTQQAFTYKNDKEALGKEKFSFPEEVLANKYADCEDKSILFAYLAKEVLHIPSVALIYYVQNHLNVAVQYNQKKGYSFIYKNQKYLVCEPSGADFAPGQNVYDISKASIVSW